VPAPHLRIVWHGLASSVTEAAHSSGHFTSSQRRNLAGMLAPVTLAAGVECLDYAFCSRPFMGFCTRRCSVGTHIQARTVCLPVPVPHAALSDWGRLRLACGLGNRSWRSCGHLWSLARLLHNSSCVDMCCASRWQHLAALWTGPCCVWHHLSRGWVLWYPSTGCQAMWGHTGQQCVRRTDKQEQRWHCFLGLLGCSAVCAHVARVLQPAWRASALPIAWFCCMAAGGGVA
jgi:hypothetical protein